MDLLKVQKSLSMSELKRQDPTCTEQKKNNASFESAKLYVWRISYQFNKKN